MLRAQAPGGETLHQLEFDGLLSAIYAAPLETGSLRAALLQLERAYDTLYTSFVLNIKDVGFGSLDGDALAGARTCPPSAEPFDPTIQKLWEWPRGVPLVFRDVEGLYDNPDVGPVAQFLMPSHRGRSARLSF